MSRTDEVVDGVKRMILDGRLRPGDRLPVEKELAAELGVSRGSLREGVRALSILGVLDTRQGDGTYVTSLDPERLLAPMGFVIDLHGESDAESFHAVRRLLETEAAALAARSIDEHGLAEARRLLDTAAAALHEEPLDHERLLETDIAFHRAIATAAGNPVLAALVETLASRTVRARLWRSRTDDDVVRRTHREHEEILAALAAGDPDRARLRMAVHLVGVEDFVHSAGSSGAGGDGGPEHPSQDG